MYITYFNFSVTMYIIMPAILKKQYFIIKKFYLSSLVIYLFEHPQHYLASISNNLLVKSI